MKNYTHYQPDEKGKSDFYSWNLFRWLRRQDKETSPRLKKTKIFRDDEGVLYIGSRYDQDEKNVSGFRLRELCSGLSNNKFPMVFWYPQSDKWEEVTEWFWSQYELSGVCTIHGDLAHDWHVLSDQQLRICNHCGVVEKKKVELVEQVTWESVE